MQLPKFWSYFFSRAIYGAGAVVALGLIGSFLIFYAFERSQADRARDLLLSRTAAADPIIIKSVEQHLERLDNVGDVFAFQAGASQAAFRLVADGLMHKYPAYESVSWVPVVKSEDEKKFEDEA